MTGTFLLVAVVAAAAGFGLAWLLRRVPALQSGEAKPEPGAGWRKAAETQGDQLVSIIADSVPDAVLFFSDLGEIRYANSVARELFFEGKAPQGQNFIRLVADAPVPLREALLGESDRLFSMDLDGRRETYHVSRRAFVLDDELHTLLTVKYMTREIGRREVEVLKRVVRVVSHATR
jgi:PAS domain-containing protein